MDHTRLMETEIIPLLTAAGRPSAASVSSVETQTYSVGEAALVFGVSSVTVYRLIVRVRRLFRPLPYLRHKRIPKRQVQAFLDGVASGD